MPKRVLIVLLCLVLPWSPLFPVYAASPPALGGGSEIASRYPNARIIQVAPDEYPALVQRLSRQGYRQVGERIVLSANTQDSAGSLPPSAGMNGAGQSPPSDGCADRLDNSAADDESLRLALNITDDLMSGRGGDDGAVVLFVLVGAVVLVVWTLYAVKYLYDVSYGVTPCGHWSEMVVSSSSISSDEHEHARFNGLRYMTGFREGATDIGISAEIGHSDILLSEVDPLQLQGVYWLVGPLLRWRFGQSANPHYFQMEFVAGSTEHRQMGIIALAKMGLNFGVGGGLRWGLNFGAISIDLNEDEGIVTDRDRLYYLMGLELGYRF